MSYLLGNTIKLNVTFKDFEGELFDPSIVKVKIYDSRYNLIEEISDTRIKKDSLGSYYFYYTIPDSVKSGTSLYYEWYSEKGGLPVIARKKLSVYFAMSQ